MAGKTIIYMGNFTVGNAAYAYKNTNTFWYPATD
jgi:hypothetical protein